MTLTLTDHHPNTTGVAGVHAALDAMSTQGWAGLEPDEVRRLAAEIARAQSRLTAHAMAAARTLEKSGAARDAGATSTGDLLAKDFGGDRRAGDRLVRRAERLESATQTEAALAAGKVTADQADVIATGLAKLPETATPDQRSLAERTLLKDAERFKLPDLRRRTDRIVDVYQTKRETDAFENDLLKERERCARAKTQARLWNNHDGTYSGDFTIPELAGVQLKTFLDAATAPRRDHLQAPDESMDRAHLAGIALADMIGHLPKDGLPSQGSASAIVMVTMDVDTLTDGLEAATLSDGTRISADQARKLACEADLIPAVLDGPSQVLDLGRQARYFTKNQRLAAGAVYGGCVFPDCDRPIQWTEMHHITPWSHGGTTNQDEAAPYCSRHHHVVHDHHWETRKDPDGTIWLRPPQGTWQTNHRWRP